MLGALIEPGGRGSAPGVAVVMQEGVAHSVDAVGTHFGRSLLQVSCWRRIRRLVGVELLEKREVDADVALSRANHCR